MSNVSGRSGRSGRSGWSSTLTPDADASTRAARRNRRVVLFGMHGVSARAALEALVVAGYPVVAVVLPGPPGVRTLSPLPPGGMSAPVVPVVNGVGSGEQEGTAVDLLARQAGIPVVLIGDLGAASVSAVAELQPDLIAVACFPWKFPPRLLQVPRLGCLNVHPSLLPDGRGADPIAWALQRGERATGVTVHLMDEGFDTGPILLQERVMIPQGIDASDLAQALATLGGPLLVQAIDGLVSGQLQPIAQ